MPIHEPYEAISRALQALATRVQTTRGGLQTIMSSEEFRLAVHAYLMQLENKLVEKNQAYGDAALSPVRIFSKADALEQIRVRIDDKLKRIQTGRPEDTEDSKDDLIGYLVLEQIKMAEMSRSGDGSV